MYTVINNPEREQNVNNVLVYSHSCQVHTEHTPPPPGKIYYLKYTSTPEFPVSEKNTKKNFWPPSWTAATNRTAGPHSSSSTIKAHHGQHKLLTCASPMVWDGSGDGVLLWAFSSPEGAGVDPTGGPMEAGAEVPASPGLRAAAPAAWGVGATCGNWTQTKHISDDDFEGKRHRHRANDERGVTSTTNATTATEFFTQNSIISRNHSNSMSLLYEK